MALIGEHKDESRGLWRSLKSAIGRLEGLLFDQKQDEGLRKRAEAVSGAYYDQTRPAATTGPTEAPDTGGWVEDVFPDHVIVHKGGKIWSVPYAQAEGKYVFDLGKAAEVAIQYVPVKELPSFQITKDAEGNLRWLGVVSNNFRDRDNPPQIIEAKAHQEFEEYLDKGGDYPPLMIWHTAGTEFGTTDCMGEHEGFVFATGTINKGMEPVAEALSKEKVDLGMSHGFEYRYSDAAKEIIGFYRIREVSVLPLEFAANPWTAFRTIDKEKEMKPEKKSFLERVLGKDRVDTLAKSLGEASASLKAQVESKEVKPEVKPAPETKPPAVAAAVAAKETPAEPDISEAEEKALKELADTVVTVKDIVKALPDMVKRIEALEAGNKALADENAKLKAEIKKSQDEIVAQAFNPRGGFAYVPSRATDNVVKEGDSLAQAKPVVDGQFFTSMGLATPGK